MKKKILHIIPNLNMGGAETDMISKILVLKDVFDFKVFCIEEKGILSERLSSENIEIISGNIRSPLQIFKLFSVLMKIRKWKPDTLHAHMFPAYVVANISMLFGIGNKIIYTIQKEAYRAGWIEVKIEWFLRPFAWKILTSSKKVLQSYYDRGIKGNNIQYMYNSIDFFKFNNSKNLLKEKLKTDNGFIIGTIGRLLPVKGHRYFLEAVPKILEKHPNTKVVIIGDGQEKENLLSLSDNLGVTGSIYWLGERTDIQNFLPYFDVFVMPSISESFGIAAAEAMACGVPVVATNVGGLAEIIINKESGFLVPTKNPEEIAEKVILLLSNSSLRKTVGNVAKKHANKFSSTVLAEELKHLYKEN